MPTVLLVMFWFNASSGSITTATIAILGRDDSAIALLGGVDMARRTDLRIDRGGDYTLTMTLPAGTDASAWTVISTIKAADGSGDAVWTSQWAVGESNNVLTTRWTAANTNQDPTKVYSWDTARTSPNKAVLGKGALVIEQDNSL